VTTYILAGGNDRASRGYWTDLASAILHDKPLRVLSCMFARPKEIWQETYDGYQSFFKMAFGDDMTSVLAQTDSFVDQIKAADVIYLHGGDTRLLKKLLSQYYNLQQLLEGKIVIGSSAGAQFLSNKYWSCGTRTLGEGSGFTDLNTIVHYNSNYGSDDPRGPIDWQQAEQQLQQMIGAEKVTRLPEGKFVKVTI
jgi:hypothetical protein